MKKYICILLSMVMMLSVVPIVSAENSPNVVIPFMYDEAHSFSEGLAAVRKGEKWGFIDQTGKTVIPFIYDQVDWHGFQDGVIAAVIDRKVGLIDQDGDEVTAFIYDTFLGSGFINGTLIVGQNGKTGAIDRTGTQVVPPVYDHVSYLSTESDESELYFVVSRDGKTGILDLTGKVIIEPRYDRMMHSFFNGMLTVWKDGKMGFLDTSFQEVIPPRFEYASYFSMGLSSVTENGRSFFIDTTGKETTPPRPYYSELKYVNGLARMYRHDDGALKYGFMDTSGKIVIDPIYEQASHFSHPVSEVKLDGQWGAIDRTGQWIVSPQYDDVWVRSEHVLVVQKNDKYALFNYEGQPLSDFIYSDVFTLDTDGQYYIVSKDGLSGVIDRFGHVMISPQFESIGGVGGGYGDGLIAVRSGGRWGFVEMPSEPLQHAPDTMKELQIEIDNSALTLVENDRHTLQPAVNAEDAQLSYASSDEWVATVSSDGTITARRPGTAVISIQAKKSGYQDGFATVFVTVTGLHTFDLTVEPSVLVLRQGETKKMATNLPDEAKLETTVQNRNVASVEWEGRSGSIQGLRSGDTLVTIKASMPGYREEAATVHVIVAGDTVNVEQALANWGKRLSAIPSQDKDTRNVREAVTTEAEHLIASLVTRSLERVHGSYTVEQSLLTEMAQQLKRIKALVDKQLEDAGMLTDRGLQLALTVGVDSPGEDGSIRVRLNKDAFDKLDGVDLLYLQFKPLGAAIGLDVSTIDALFGNDRFLDIVVYKEQDSYQIWFLDEAGHEIAKTSENVTIVLPIDDGHPYLASVFLQEETAITHIGGSYDAYNQGVSFQTKSSGSYYVANESKAYADMAGKDEEMKQAVDFLSSKGIISGVTEDTFDPDANLTRAQFVTMLVRSFYALDPSARADFKDVKETDWFHPYVASSQQEQIVHGMEDGTFRPSEYITKEQMAAVVSRSMVNKRKYAYPENSMDYLAFIQDRNEVSGWAEKEVALAIKERLFEISADSRFAPQSLVSRGEAARTLYRLFLKLY